MADLSRTDWTTSDTPVLATVLNNIGLDIRTAGANRDLGGYQIVNCGGITVTAGGKALFGTSTDRGVRVLALSVSAAGLPTAGAGSGAMFVGESGGGFGWLTGALSSGNMWLQCQRVDGSAALYDLCLQPLGGKVVIGASSGTSILHVAGLPSYASNAGAITGGLTAGAFYRNGDNVCVVH